MLGDYAARCRKGTKSCSECRRRKVRCIRIPEDAPACRKCEERGTECTVQIYSSTRTTPRLSSRYRIYQLESQLAGLTERVRDVEARLGCQATQALDYPATESLVRESSDDESNASDLLATDQPSHLHSLFHNDLLRVHSRQKARNLQDGREIHSTPLLDNARRALQRLIPPKDEIVEIMKSGSEWLTMAQILFAQPFTAGSEQEILESYDQMCNPAVDTISLASWLLVIAITAQQVSRAHESSSPGHRSYGTQLRLSRAISDTVEERLLPHDRIIGTTRGLAMFVHFLRLQIGQGRFQKAWIRLRHIIAIAELMGLPKLFQAAHAQHRSTKTDYSEAQLGGAQIWELISTVDRLLGLIINIPPDTNRYNQIKHQPLAIDGVIQPAVYFKKLTDIAGKIHRLDDLDVTHEFDSEVYASALELCRELRELASQTPQSWWIRDRNRVEPDHIVQFMHYYILVRIHLPFVLSQHSGEEYLYSRLACMDACEAVLQRYLVLRRILPPGFLLCAMLDLHAFTAAVLVLLVSHSSTTTGRFNLHVDKVRIHTEVEQVIDLMRERSNGTSESHFSQDGVTTLSSLNHHLQDENVAAGLELTLNVPLLGRVHVRRSPPQAANVNPWPSRVPSDLGLLKPSQQSLLPTSHENNSAITDRGGQEEGRWDSISWSIEDNERFFQDFLMTDDFEPFSM